jgi:hypothetical protein
MVEKQRKVKMMNLVRGKEDGESGLSKISLKER